MRKQKKTRVAFGRLFPSSRDESNLSALSALKSAWDRLPQDMTPEERLIFIEIAERIVRLNRRIQNIFEEANKEEN